MATLWKPNRMDAFEKLYFENYTSLCRMVHRFVRDTDIARDIVQDVFIKYWKLQQGNVIHEIPEAYLHRACINESLNFLKERDRRTSREGTYAEDRSDYAGTADQPDATLMAEETTSSITTAIDGLPPVCRQTFLLSRYEYKSYTEIAALLNISVNTVEKHIGKALSVLRMVLKKN